MEDSLDKALRKWVPAHDSFLIKEAINQGQDISLKYGMVRGNLVSLIRMKDSKVFTWDISDS